MVLLMVPRHQLRMQREHYRGYDLTIATTDGTSWTSMVTATDPRRPQIQIRDGEDPDALLDLVKNQIDDALDRH